MIKRLIYIIFLFPCFFIDGILFPFYIIYWIIKGKHIKYLIIEKLEKLIN